MTIALAAQMLPRLELPFLEEWIEYHSKIGIDRIYLYDNGPKCVDPIFGTDAVGMSWGKKPEANYHPQLYNSIIADRISDAVSRWLHQVQVIPWHTPEGSNFRRQQLAAVQDACGRAEEDGFQWLAHFDLDELIVCDDLGKYFDDLDPVVNAVTVRQKVFKSRFQKMRPVPYRENTQTYGTVHWNPKQIARVAASPRWKNPHRVDVPGIHITAGADWLRFHHFRGNQFFGDEKKIPRGWQLRNYMRLQDSELHEETGHVI